MVKVSIICLLSIVKDVKVSRIKVVNVPKKPPPPCSVIGALELPIEKEIRAMGLIHFSSLAGVNIN